MTTRAPHDEAAACLAALEAALAGGDPPALARVSPSVLDDALRALVKGHGAGALPLAIAWRNVSSSTGARSGAPSTGSISRGSAHRARPPRRPRARW